MTTSGMRERFLAGLRRLLLGKNASSRALRTWLQSADLLPYVTHYSVSRGFNLPAGFRMSEWKGLRHVQIVDDSNSGQLLLFWKDSQFAAAVEPALRSAIGLTAPTWSGAVSRSRFARMSLRPRSVGDALIRMSTIVGAWTALSLSWLGLFGKPDVFFSRSSVVNVGVGRDFPIRISAVNRIYSNDFPGGNYVVRFTTAPQAA